MGRLARSLEVVLLGPQHPLREPLALLALRDVMAHHPLDVVAELLARDLEPAELAAEAGIEAQTTAEVHLEALDLLALVHDELALQADVGDLGAGAGVGAAVHVDRDRGVQRREPLLELADQVGLGLTQKGYALTNLRADWEIKPNLVASLWARNVFDQNYAVGGVNVYDSLGYNFVYPGEPKTYGVELNVKF